MTKKKVTYFNFPIQLLKGFMVDSDTCLSNISRYAVYAHSETLIHGNEVERFKSSADYLNISFGKTDNEMLAALNKGKILCESIPLNSPKVGIEKDMFWDFFKNNKTEFEKITLLGFLAIKSILQKKSYCKITNKFWLSRMDGKTSSVNEYYQLSNEVKKYSVNYQLRKIKAELERNWNLKTVSGRGFNVSFKMSLDDLTYVVLKRRKVYQDKVLKEQKDEAKKKALNRLYATQP